MTCYGMFEPPRDYDSTRMPGTLRVISFTQKHSTRQIKTTRQHNDDASQLYSVKWHQTEGCYD